MCSLNPLHQLKRDFSEGPLCSMERNPGVDLLDKDSCFRSLTIL